MAYELKTKQNDGDVEAFLDTIEPQQKQTDSRTIVEMMATITGEAPKMWGESIIGFGSYHYRYASGQEGDWMLVGFAPRKQALTLYLMSGYEDWDDLTANLGKFKTGKSCLYVKRLADVDQHILRQMIERSVEQMRASNPT